MTELETLLLQQLERQQRDSERLVNGLSVQLDRLQTALDAQQAENQAIRRQIEQNDQRHAQAIDALTQRWNALIAQLNRFGQQSSG